MSAPTSKWPLTWPPGWRRTSPGARTDARFSQGDRRLDLRDGTRRVISELGIFGVPEGRILISSNHALKRDGVPYSNQPALDADPGVAVYWKRNGTEQCMAIDRYKRLPDNLAAIAATVYAMRAIERHGGAEIIDRAFTGFAALAAPLQWFQVLEVPANANLYDIEQAYRRLASKHHPDKTKDDGEAMALINRARDQAMEQFS
jgi:hypothetical protein